MVENEIPRIPGLVRDRKVDGLPKSSRIDPGFPRRFVLPHRVRIIDGGSVVAPVRLPSGAQRSRDVQQSKDRHTNGHGFLRHKRPVGVANVSIVCRRNGAPALHETPASDGRIPMPRYLGALRLLPRYLRISPIVLLPGMVLTRIFLLKRRGINAMKFGNIR
jgi:hypothetical protein